MDMRKVKKLLDLGWSTYKIAEELKVPKTTLYDAMKKEGLKASRKQHQRKPYLCKECGETDESKFYAKRKDQCTSCHSKMTNERHKNTRQAGIDFLGGKCSVCGYNKCSKALEFHHVDASVKDSNFRTNRGWSVKRLLKELENCVLLCANCHREEHDRLSKQ
jgi:hypothetical protein